MFWNKLFGRIKEKELGKVVHYFDKIQVAVLSLNGNLKVGDKIKVSRGENEFEQEVESMQIDHQEVQSAGKGQEVAIKVAQPAKTGTRICKV